MMNQNEIMGKSFLSFNNRKNLTDYLYDQHEKLNGPENKKKFIKRVEYLMETWVLSFSQFFPEMNNLGTKFLNRQFIEENKDYIFGRISGKTKQFKYSPYSTYDLQRNLAYNGGGMYFKGTESINLVAHDFHPRHVSQKMLWTRRHKMQREEPHYNFRYRSADNMLRKYDLRNLGFNNLWFDKNPS